MRVGSHVRSTVIMSGAAHIAKIPQLSKAAKLRLRWFDYYQAHGRNAALTCRHFGITRSNFYKWKARYELIGIRGLETHSTRPRRTRQPTTLLSTVDLVRSLRKRNPEYSKYKLAVVLKRDYGIVLSPSTIGRIINQYQLFFTRPVKPKNHPHRRVRIRKPKDLNPVSPGDLVEVDVKHLPNIDCKQYAFVAIDVVSKQVSVHVSTSISATQGAIAWTKACEQFQFEPQAVLNDNGSENLGKFAQVLEELETPQYFARPRTPKDKPHVERMIGTIERECIQWGGLAANVADQQELIDTWLTKYHSYRPHQSLGYLTPDEYQAKLEGKVSSM